MAVAEAVPQSLLLSGERGHPGSGQLRPAPVPGRARARTWHFCRARKALTKKTLHFLNLRAKGRGSREL